MTPTRSGIAFRLLLSGVLLAFPIWYPPLLRRLDPRASRRELAIEAERRARAGAEIVRSSTGETLHAVAYTPGDPAHGATAMRSATWLFRLLALMLVTELVASAVTSAGRASNVTD